MIVENSFSVFINKLRHKTENNCKKKIELPTGDDSTDEKVEKENEWLQEYELIYRSYALER